MAREPRQIADPELEALSDSFKMGRMSAETELNKLTSEIEAIREEAECSGVLKKIAFDNGCNELMKYTMLMRVKRSKSYRKGGLTWEEYCEQVIGEPVRSVDLKLKESCPVLQKFSANFAEISGVDFGNIRMLGRSISANLAEITDDGVIVMDDYRVPITPEHAEDIKALIEGLKDDMAKQIGELKADLRARDRRLDDKEKDLNRLHKQLDTYEAKAAGKQMTAEEDAFLQKVFTLRIGFDGYMLKMEAACDDLLGRGHTPREAAALISTLDYMRMTTTAWHERSVMEIGGPSLNPQVLDEFEAWEKEHMAPYLKEKPGKKQKLPE